MAEKPTSSSASGSPPRSRRSTAATSRRCSSRWQDELDGLRIEAVGIEVEDAFCLFAGRFIGRPGGGAELAVPVFVVLEFDPEDLTVITAEEYLDEREAERRFAALAGL